ncbi:MAG: hypothetical protein FJZ89_01640 [Chloroflexi bacterium]|nr:hypothetical protein [Chloroflexota bacterium]
MAVIPVTTTVNISQTFSVNVQVQAGAQQVDGASAYLDFNPTYLQVISLSPGTTLPIILQNSYNNATGRIDFAAGNLTPPHPDGTFTLVTITFAAQAPTSGTPLAFNSIPPRKSDATFGGASVLNHTEDGMAVIANDAILYGSVILQGRPTPPNPRWATNLTVSLTEPGEGLPRYSFTLTTDDRGHFTLRGIQPGTYEVRVKNSHTLQNKVTVTLVGGNNAVDFGALREGDANNDNFVTLLDFSILASTFGKCQDTAGYDDRADFNEDQCVSLLDFSLLASNFGQAGQTRSQAQRLAELELEIGSVLLVIDPPVATVTPGQVFTLTVQVQAGTQQVDGAQASLDFSPAFVRVQRLTAGTALPLILLNQFNNTAGTIDHAAGALADFPSGTFVLVQIQFEALAETAGTPLAFHFGLPRDSDVAFGGVSVLGGTSNGAIVVQSPTATPTPTPTPTLTPTAMPGFHIYLPLIMKGWLIWVPDTPTPTPTPFDYYWEPNDTFEQATMITPTMNSTYIGVISTATDVDFYQFGVTAASAQVYISLNHLPLDYDLYLYDGTRTLIDYSINGGLANEYITRTLTSGLYYIKISSASGGYDYRPYTLQVTLVPPPSPAALLTPPRAMPGGGNRKDGA